MTAATAIADLKKQYAYQAASFSTNDLLPDGGTPDELRAWSARREALAEKEFKAWLRSRRCLWLPAAGPCLLIPGATGVVFHVQAGGHACSQFFIEALAIPLATREPGAYVLNPGPAWLAWPSASAQEIVDDLLDSENSGTVHSLKAIEHPDNMEGWMWVTGVYSETSDAFMGVLTWPNSD